MDKGIVIEDKKDKTSGNINEKEKIYIFDTTLRDGAQTEELIFSLEDKNKIANVLSNIGIDYIEGGWPGANPVDTKFFDNPLNIGNLNLQHLE